MYFENGSLTSGSTTLADDLRQALVDGLTNAITAGYTNWTITDHDYVNGTVTSTTVENSSGFAVVLMNNTGTTNNRVDLLLRLGTDWVTGTKTLNNRAFEVNTTSYTPDINGYSGTSYTIPSTMPTLNSANQLYRLTATSSQSDWSIHVENDYLYFSFKNNASTKGEWLFFGAFDTLVSNPLLSDNEPFALTTSEAKSYGGSNGGIAVLKSLTPGSNSVQNGACFGFRSTGAAADVSTYDKYSANPTSALTSPIYFSRGTSPRVNNTVNESNINSAPDDSNLYGYLRGQLPDIYFSYADNANWGDTVQVNGQVYMYAGGTWHHHSWLNNDRSIAGWIKIDLTGES